MKVSPLECFAVYAIVCHDFLASPKILRFVVIKLMLTTIKFIIDYTHYSSFPI